jgi:hypothetical protein
MLYIYIVYSYRVLRWARGQLWSYIGCTTTNYSMMFILEHTLINTASIKPTWRLNKRNGDAKNANWCFATWEGWGNINGSSMHIRAYIIIEFLAAYPASGTLSSVVKYHNQHELVSLSLRLHTVRILPLPLLNMAFALLLQANYGYIDSTYDNWYLCHLGHRTYDAILILNTCSDNSSLVNQIFFDITFNRFWITFK